MKKIYSALLFSILLLGTASCSDFLDQTSPSQVDKDFVFSDATTARAALQNVYSEWRTNGQVHGNGIFYDMTVSGSDCETQPESYTSQINRWLMSYFYGWNSTETTWGTENVSISGNGDFNNVWTNLYKIIGLTNTIINNYKESSGFEEMMAQGEPSELSEIYGEAVTMRAMLYYELTRYYGDVPFQTQSGEEATHLTNRDSINEYILNDLESVIPLMYRQGESSSINKTYLSRTFAEGLIGRICLWEGGYQTRRTDLGSDYYTNLDGEVLSFETVNESSSRKCFYGRRSDWKTFYEKAETYLAAAISNPGDVKLQTTDPRTDARYSSTPNPFQYVFQQTMMGVNTEELTYADESVYEIPETHANSNSERPYAFGRPSNGGSSSYYPCKSYGQSRFTPVYYYGDFDPNDLRRDVTCTVTGSDGHGAEALLSFNKGSRLNGGIALNKWDENRMSNPYTVKQRNSGINNPYMRFSEIILMQAEIKAALGEDAEARSYLDMIRNRAFGSATLAKTDEFISECGSLLNAIIEERKFEFGGEGMRRWDLIRTNRLSWAVNRYHELAGAMIEGLKTNGYYTFDNGNTISNYVWTKLVDAKTLYGYRLTAQCPTDSTNNPVLYPGWRGQNDDWASVAASNGTSTSSLTAGDSTNLAIKGLFTYIDPNGEEAAELEAQGYTRQNWGIDIVDAEKQYDYYIFSGYKDGEPPIYMLPMGNVIIQNSNGKFVNGYGFTSDYE
jgi:hypothetical protein